MKFSCKTILILSVIVSQLYFHTSAQEISTDKQLLGTFIFKENVFNYTFKYPKDGAYSIQFERVTGGKTTLSEISKKFFEDVRKVLKENTVNWNINTDSSSYQSKIDASEKSFNESVTAIASSTTNLKDLSTLLEQKRQTISENGTKTKLTSLLDKIKDFSSVITAGSLPGQSHPFNEIKEEFFLGLLTDDLRKWGLYADTDLEPVKTLSNKLYNEINIRSKFKDDEPVTGYLKLLSDIIPIYNAQTGSLLMKMKVSDIQFEFEDGTIKNIYAEFSLPGIDGPVGNFEFRNNTPISVSGKFDADRFDSQKIFSYKISKEQAQQLNTMLKTEVTEGSYCYFRLGDVVKYLLVLENQKEDYSPANIKVNLSPESPIAVLKKQLRSEILVLKTFSDFNGIDNGTPNGLIQFEGALGVNLLTKRFQGLAIKPRPYNWYTGFFTRIELNGTLSKIEEKNKYLVLNGSFLNKDSMKIDVKSFNINALNLLKYQNSIIGVNLNVYKLNIPQTKLNLKVNGLASILNTGITDSLVLDKTSSTGYSILPKRISRVATSSNFSYIVQLEFSPQNRYGFSVGYRKSYINPLATDVTRLTGKDRVISTTMIDGFISTGESSRVFFRSYFNKLATNSRINYNQVQLGYSVNIFKTNTK